jgi:hypothetical protein
MINVLIEAINIDNQYFIEIYSASFKMLEALFKSYQ